MHRLSSVPKRLALVVASLATALVGLLPFTASANALTAHYYVALGDSYPYGYQPDGDWSHGYTDQFAQMLQQNDPNVTLVNMACWGETTSTLINGGCPGPSNGIPTKVPYDGSQLNTAKEFLATNGSAVKLVTIDVGLNDLVDNCFNQYSGRVNYTCVSKELPIIEANELTIISTLRSVASPATQFMIANTFDAYQNLLPNTILAVQEFNQTISDVSQQANVPLVDIADAFHMNDYPNGGNPYLCPVGNPLTWACVAADSHPTTAGYQLMATTFDQEYVSL